LCSGFVEEEFSAFPDVLIPAAVTRRLGTELQPWQLEALRHPLGADYLLKRQVKMARRGVVEEVLRAVAAKEEARIAAAAADGWEVSRYKRDSCNARVEEVMLPLVMLAHDRLPTVVELQVLRRMEYLQYLSKLETRLDAVRDSFMRLADEPFVGEFAGTLLDLCARADKIAGANEARLARCAVLPELIEAWKAACQLYEGPDKEAQEELNARLRALPPEERFPGVVPSREGPRLVLPPKPKQAAPKPPASKGGGAASCAQMAAYESQVAKLEAQHARAMATWNAEVAPLRAAHEAAQAAHEAGWRAYKAFGAMAGPRNAAIKAEAVEIRAQLAELRPRVTVLKAARDAARELCHEKHMERLEAALVSLIGEQESAQVTLVPMAKRIVPLLQKVHELRWLEGRVGRMSQRCEGYSPPPLFVHSVDSVLKLRIDFAWELRRISPDTDLCALLEKVSAFPEHPVLKERLNWEERKEQRQAQLKEQRAAEKAAADARARQQVRAPKKRSKGTGGGKSGGKGRNGRRQAWEAGKEDLAELVQTLEDASTTSARAIELAGQFFKVVAAMGERRYTCVDLKGSACVDMLTAPKRVRLRPGTIVLAAAFPKVTAVVLPKRKEGDLSDRLCSVLAKLGVPFATGFFDGVEGSGEDEDFGFEFESESESEEEEVKREPSRSVHTLEDMGLPLPPVEAEESEAESEEEEVVLDKKARRAARLAAASVASKVVSASVAPKVVSASVAPKVVSASVAPKVVSASVAPKVVDPVVSAFGALLSEPNTSTLQAVMSVCKGISFPERMRKFQLAMPEVLHATTERVFDMLYREDVFEEEYLLAWAGGVNVLPRDEEVKAKVANFITWLRTAEEESDAESAPPAAVEALGYEAIEAAFMSATPAETAAAALLASAPPALLAAVSPAPLAAEADDEEDAPAAAAGGASKWQKGAVESESDDDERPKKGARRMSDKEKEARLQMRLAAMSPEERADWEERQQEREERKAMRKAAFEEKSKQQRALAAARKGGKGQGKGKGKGGKGGYDSE
jgi:hypothetical protein